MIHKWYSILHKLIAAISLILGIFVIFGCTVALMNVLKAASQNSEESNTTFSRVYNETTPPETPQPHAVIKGNAEYKNILKICVGLAIGAGFVQFMSSLYSCFTSTKDAGYKIKIWIGIHFLIITLLIVCLLLPWGFGEDDGKPQSMKSFSYTVEENAGNIFKMEKPIVEHFKEGLKLYYVALIVNISMVAILALISTCFLRWGEYAYETIDDKFELY